jgi:hypothetical protein
VTDAADDKVVQLRKAIETPAKKVRAKPKVEKEKPGGGSGEGPPPSDPRGKKPLRLPPDAPVKALGKLGTDAFYLDCDGQLIKLAPTEHGRTHILTLFGGKEYLAEIWPVWKQDKDGDWHKTGDFNHADIAPVLIGSARDKGIWDPAHKVRGCGAWLEDDGTLVMHCGDKLVMNVRGHSVTTETGVREDLLYPKRAPLPHPEFSGEPGPRLFDMLREWNWARDDVDAALVQGWILCAMLGAAQPWRPAIWITGGKGRGKSTVQKLINWLFGDAGIIRPANATPAFIYQTIGDSCLPVSLDEFEAKADNAIQERVLELMTVAASGGEVGRGGTENNPKTYNLRSCFLFGSINVQALSPQNRSRLAICELLPLNAAGDQEEFEFDEDAPEDDDVTLGTRESWARTGKQLRGRLLVQWPRYIKTFRAYRFCLLQVGHDKRAAEQFGALGAGYDLSMHDDFSMERAKEWAARLPPATLSETTGYEDNARGCLNHLLMATPDLVRHGTRETVSHYLQESRADLDCNVHRNDVESSATRVLAKLGIRVVRADVDELLDGKLQFPWLIEVSNSNPGLREIFAQTAWKGRPDAPGTWGQALRDLPLAGKPVQKRIDKIKQWVTPLRWDVVFDTDGDDRKMDGG